MIIKEVFNMETGEMEQFDYKKEPQKNHFVIWGNYDEKTLARLKKRVMALYKQMKKEENTKRKLE
jgi:inhibitor of KinA sporulation pathway (predicted exonuclease)